MKLTYFCHNISENRNEDSILVDTENNIYGVFDGKSIDNKILPAQIFTESMREFEGDLKGKIINANENLRRKHLEIYNIEDFNEVSNNFKNVCSGVAIQIDKDHKFMEFLHTGNCMLSVQYKNYRVELLTEDKLSDYLTEDNEYLLQLTDDIPIFDGSMAVNEKLTTKKIDISNIKKILIISDGLLINKEEKDFRRVWEMSTLYAFSKNILDLDNYVKFQEKNIKIDNKSAIMIEL